MKKIRKRRKTLSKAVDFIDHGKVTVIKNLQKKIPISPKRIKKAVLKIFSLVGRNSLRSRITICFVDDKTIKKLNWKYLRKNSPTDVLAFENSDKKNPSYISADIVISTDTASHNAGIFKTTPVYELFLYITHGILHLLGYDDKTKKQRERMHKQEKDILSKLLKLSITDYVYP